jgi:hypothetical protein
MCTYIIFTVEHCLASRSYLTCHNEFRDTLTDSSASNKSTVSRPVDSFRDTGSVQDRNRSGRPSVLNEDTERGRTFPALNITSSSVLRFQCNFAFFFFFCKQDVAGMN